MVWRRVILSTVSCAPPGHAHRPQKVTTALKALFGNDSRPHLSTFTAQPGHWQSLTVLVAEDHACYRLLIGEYLDTLGLAHEVVENAQSALDLMALRHFDLLLSDCQMPGMDGYGLARAVRRRERREGLARVPIIVLTAVPDPERAEALLTADIDAWLIKPLALEHLQPVLERWLPSTVSVTQAPGQPAVVQGAGRATRASLIQLFGSAEVVDRLLTSLLQEASEDRAALAHALLHLDTVQVTERLHRLVGGLAFLGEPELERQGVGLIGAVRSTGLTANHASLERFQHDLERYLEYLARI